MRKRKKSFHDTAAEIQLASFIVPMLDMAFQLLAFFIMSYNPNTLREAHFDGALLPPPPPPKEAPKFGPNEAKKPELSEVKNDPPPEMEEAITLIVTAVPRGEIYETRVKGKEKRDGMPAKISIQLPTQPTAELIANVEDPADEAIKRLSDHLRAYVKSLPAAGDKSVTKMKLNIEADDNLKHQYFIQIYDVCKASQFTRISFAQPPGLRPDAKIGGVP
jgi:biopolymer transport protein ExbD